ncbi:MAG: hypothetical protein CEE43_12360 [Promethearchaeota archaeon Loki_b32]|nr:MAG: hypothetical protein CEE43_12360 [Candidatus Lokiarchaeota archaeon Loki_b32]
MKEFKVNEFITLKLVDNKTEIFVKNQMFRQCKFLLITIPIEQIDAYKELESIDEAAEKLDKSLERDNSSHFQIPPEVEFWAHCSNIQVWAENNYDTRLLHSNLAFPLLKKLSEVGDAFAKKVFKEEIGKRFQAGNENTQRFLIKEGYLKYLSKEMILSLIPESDLILELERIIQKEMEIRTKDNIIGRGYVLKNNKISWLILKNVKLKEIPVLIKNIKSLIGLSLSGNLMETLPDWFWDFKELEYLDLSRNLLREIPKSIENLKKLKHLNVGYNQIEELPNSIGNLTRLERLVIADNKIKLLPNSIGELKALKDFISGANSIKSIPDSIGYMTSLESLDLSETLIETLPNSIKYLKNLNALYLMDSMIKDNYLIKTLRRKGTDVFLKRITKNKKN